MKQHPILVVTGAPCVGKTSVVRELTARGNDRYILLNGRLCSAFVFPGEEETCRRDWVRLCESLSGQIGRAVVFYLNAPPDSFACVDASVRSRMAFSALVCEEKELLMRVRRKLEDAERARECVDSAALASYALQCNRSNLVSADPSLERLDTTGQTVAESADLLERWILDRIAQLEA